MKGCFIASSGGHWEELMCLSEIAGLCDGFYVTEDGGQADESSVEKLYVVPQINRHEKHFLLHFIRLFGQAFRILRQEKPEFVISTGALIAFPFCICAKLMGARIIYIESFARVHDRSLTGRLVYPIADLFLVQWESMLELYPKARYAGRIF